MKKDHHSLLPALSRGELFLGSTHTHASFLLEAVVWGIFIYYTTTGKKRKPLKAIKHRFPSKGTPANPPFILTAGIRKRSALSKSPETCNRN
jgi:hypothetical protein